MDNENLRQSEDRFRLLVESVRDYAIFMLDPHGLRSHLERRGGALQGLSMPTRSSASISRGSIRLKRWRAACPSTSSRVAAASGRFEDEGWRVRKDGSLFWANVVITALRDADGRARSASPRSRATSPSGASTRKRCARARSGSACWSKASPTTPSSCSTSTATIATWNVGAAAHQGLRGRRDHRPALLDRSIRRGAAKAAGRSTSCRSPRRRAASRTRAGACARTARSSGPTSRSRRCATRRAVCVGFAKLTRDLTERKRAEAAEAREPAARRDARSRAQRAHGRAARGAHQGRVPGHAVARAAHAAERHPGLDAGAAEARCDERRRAVQRAIEVIERNARAQVQLIDDLLDLSRIMAGKIRLDVQQMSLLSIVEARRSSPPSPRHTPRTSAWKAILDPSRPRSRRSAAACSRWSGTCSATPSSSRPKGGQVQVLLQRVNSHIELSVSDTGIGIPPSFLPHVFDRFSQRDSSTTRAYGGLGLGLAISKQLVELHGGTIRANSQGEGMGATFFVELPLSIVQLEEESLAARPSDGRDDTGELAAAEARRHPRLRRRRRAGRARVCRAGSRAIRAPR